MWGSYEAVELCALTLVETEIQHYAPEAFDESPRVVLDCYLTELYKLYPGGNTLLASIAPEKDFPNQLFKLFHNVRDILGTKYKLWGPEGKAGYNFPKDPL